MTFKTITDSLFLQKDVSSAEEKSINNMLVNSSRPTIIGRYPSLKYGATQRSDISIFKCSNSLALFSLNRSEQVHADRPQGLIYLADTFIQIDVHVHMRTIEAIKTNKRAMICKCCEKPRLDG